MNRTLKSALRASTTSGSDVPFRKESNELFAQRLFFVQVNSKHFFIGKKYIRKNFFFFFFFLLSFNFAHFSRRKTCLFYFLLRKKKATKKFFFLKSCAVKNNSFKYLCVISIFPSRSKNISYSKYIKYIVIEKIFTM